MLYFDADIHILSSGVSKDLLIVLVVPEIVKEGGSECMGQVMEGCVY